MSLYVTAVQKYNSSPKNYRKFWILDFQFSIRPLSLFIPSVRPSTLRQAQGPQAQGVLSNILSNHSPTLPLAKSPPLSSYVFVI